MNAAPPPLLADCEIALVAIPLFLVFWNLIIAAASIIGGWHGLSKRFRREETTFRIGGGPIERYRWATLNMGPKYFPMNYGNCVTVSLSDEGLGLQVMPLFRALHPPLTNPWNAIESCSLKKELRFFDWATVKLRDLENPLRICGRAGQAIVRYWTTREQPLPRE